MIFLLILQFGPPKYEFLATPLATSTFSVNNPFQCPLPTALPLSEVLRVESLLPEAHSPPPRPLPSSDPSHQTSN